VQEEQKVEAIFHHFDGIFEVDAPRVCILDFGQLQLPHVDLSGIDSCFAEEDVWAAICAMPADKAPGPDGFSGQYFRIAWSVIKTDVIRAFHALWALDFRSLYLVNQSYTFLLGKHTASEEIKDYRPIGLLHSFCKLVTKVLAVHISLFMNHLLQSNQSVFIKGRAIHDNFRVVRLSAKLLHTRKHVFF
jgi:hypothetical protein